MEGGGRYLLFRARRSNSLRDRAYRPAGTRRRQAEAKHQLWTGVWQGSELLALLQDGCQFLDVFSSFAQVELLGEQPGDTDQEGGSEGSGHI